MPWDKNDYPSSLKNFDEATRNKAIEIANAMIEEGYDEDRAIPIATDQAKEWADGASKDEKDEMKNVSNSTLKDHEEDENDTDLDLLVMMYSLNRRMWLGSSNRWCRTS